MLYIISHLSRAIISAPTVSKFSSFLRTGALCNASWPKQCYRADSYPDPLSSPPCIYSCFHIYQAHSLLSFQVTIQMQSLICCLKGFQIMQPMEKSLICLQFVVSMLCIVRAVKKKKVLGSQDALTLCSLMDWGSGGALWGKGKIASLLRITEHTWLEVSRGQDRSSHHLASKEHKKKLKTPGRSRDLPRAKPWHLWKFEYSSAP